MTLDATKPADIDAVSILASYQRETRAAVNALELLNAVVTEITQTDLTIAAGSTSLEVGTDLSTAKLEVVNAQANAGVVLTRIGKGTKGQIKIFIFEDSDISLENSTDKNNGEFSLNQLPAAGNFAAVLGDVMVLCNVGGDGSSIDGYWKELYRTLFVG